jgi:hypothetical protein
MGSQVVDARDVPVGEVGFLSCRLRDRPLLISPTKSALISRENALQTTRVG